MFRAQKKSRDMFRILYATDIHGSDVGFHKFINAAKAYDVQALILGGDITGKFLVPIVDENGVYRLTLQGVPKILRSQEELDQVTKRLEMLGSYYVVLDPDRVAEIQAHPELVAGVFREKARERLAAWVDFAEERLRGTGISCYVTGGNDDQPEVIEVLKENSREAIVPCDNEAVYIDDRHQMVSCGYSNPTPWNTPREIPDEALGEMIGGLLEGIDDFTNCIFNFHAPPLDCTLDECAQLDSSTDPPTPVVVAGQIAMAGAGSRAVRAAIEKHQPLLCLVGHIHEARGVVKIGRTTVVNPGSEYAEGIVRGTILNLGDGAIKGYQMTSG